MIRIICDACGDLVAETDKAAILGVPMFDIVTSKPLGRHDYCGRCTMIIRNELPTLAAQARRARLAALAALTVPQRARQLWGASGVKPAERIALTRRVDSTPTVE